MACFSFAISAWRGFIAVSVQVFRGTGWTQCQLIDKKFLWLENILFCQANALYCLKVVLSIHLERHFSTADLALHMPIFVIQKTKVFLVFCAYLLDEIRVLRSFCTRSTIGAFC